MWRILGLLVFCSLPSLPQGQPPGVKCVSRISLVSKCFIEKLDNEGILMKHLGTMALSNIRIGLLGIQLADLKFKAVILKDFTLTTLPHINGAKMVLVLGLDITAELLDSLKLVDLFLELKISVEYKLINFAGGFYSIEILDCSYVFGELKITTLNLLTVTLEVAIKDSLIGDIGGQICPNMKTILDQLRDEVLKIINVDFALGTYGVLRYRLAEMPIVGDGSLQIAAKVAITMPGGSILSIPSTAVSIDMPQLLDFHLCHAFHLEFLKMALSAFIDKTERTLNLIPGEFSGADGMKKAILDLMPHESMEDIGTSVWSVRMLLLDSPVVLLETEFTLVVYIDITVYVEKEDGAVVPVLILKSKVTLATAVSVVRSTLIISLTLSSNILELVSSDKGIIEVSTLLPHYNKLLSEVLVPILNEKLGLGIRLISISDTTIMADVSVMITTNSLVICM